MAVGQDLEKVLEKLRQERDELRVRMHLAGLELKEEWERIEQQWDHFEPRAEAAIRQAAGSATGALERLGEELRQAYQRVRERLPSGPQAGEENKDGPRPEQRMKVVIRYRDAEGNDFEDHLDTALNRAFLIDEEGWEEAPNESTFLTGLRRFYEGCGCYHIEIRTD